MSAWEQLQAKASPAELEALEAERVRTGTETVAYVFTGPAADAQSNRAFKRIGKPVLYSMWRFTNPERSSWCIAAITEADTAHHLRVVADICEAVGGLPTDLHPETLTSLRAQRWNTAIEGTVAALQHGEAPGEISREEHYGSGVRLGPDGQLQP